MKICSEEHAFASRRYLVLIAVSWFDSRSPNLRIVGSKRAEIVFLDF